MKRLLALLGLVALVLAGGQVDAKRVMISKGYSGAPFTYNITAANTASFRAVIAANTRNVIIPAIGDSTVDGVSSGFTTTEALTSWPVQLSNQLNTQGIASGSNNRFGVASGTWAFLLTFDNRVTGSGSWSQTAGLVFGGNAYGASAAGTMTFTPQSSVDTFAVYWFDGAAGRTFSYSVDGGATTNVSTTGTNQIGLTTPIAGGTLGSHTITLNWVAGAVNIIGIDAYNSARHELSVWNGGISGATSAQCIDNSDPQRGRFTEYNSAKMKMDLALVEGCIVNDWRTGVSVAQSKANVTALVQQLLAGGANVILVTPPFDNGTAGTTANQNAYVQELYQVAAEQGVGLVDVRIPMVSYAYSVSQGWQNSDTVHPTPLGYQFIASIVDQALTAAINNKYSSIGDVPPGNRIPANDNDRYAIETEKKAA